MLNLDTHIVFNFLDQNLTTIEKSQLDKTEIYCISDIVLWELAMLRSKGRIIFDFESPECKEFLNNLKILPICEQIAIQSAQLDFKSDPSNHIIAATSIVYEIPLLTRDKDILRSKMVPFPK